MKVLYIDTRVNGHHVTYMSAFLNWNFIQGLALIPETDEYNGKAEKLYFSEKPNGFNTYWGWIKKIKRIIKKEKPDIVHFLYGDDLYRYLGLGLSSLNCRIVVTFHQIRHSKLRNISFKMISNAVDTVVVHTSKIKRDFQRMGIRNVVHIEYPTFHVASSLSVDSAKEKLNIPKDIPVLLALGGTRTDKGLDILLNALNHVKHPFHLLIAGKEEDIRNDIITEKAAPYHERITKYLEFLSDEKMGYCLNASDIVVLPYRKSFDGASGPLGEGVALGKTIVGADHGSLGDLIRENHLGYTFESENEESLANALNVALSSAFEKDEVYQNYQDSLNVASFLKKYEAVYRELTVN